MAARTWEMNQEVRALLVSYDAQYDPIVVHEGRVEVTGPRLPDASEGGKRMLVDPLETVSNEELANGGEYFVVRETVIIQDKGFQRREYDIADLQDLFGIDEMVIDSANLIEFWDHTGERWMTYVVVALTLSFAGFVFVGLCMQAVIVGPMVRSARGGVGTVTAAIAIALVSSLPPQAAMVAFKALVFDPGFLFRSLIVFALTLPIAWLWLGSGTKA